MLPDAQPAIELLEKSEYVGIVLPQDPSLDAQLSAEVCAQILQEKGKRVGFLLPPTADSGHPPDALRFLGEAPPLPHEFIISLDTSRSPISQIRYEKLEDRVDVILSPKSVSVSDAAVSVRQGNVLCDCVLALGVPDIESRADDPRLPPAIFAQTALVNLDVSQENRRYGEANLVDPTKSSLAELCYRFLTTFREEPLSEGIATLLLAGILNATQRFQSGRTSAETLLVASELLRLGGDYSRSLDLSTPAHPLSFLQFLGRVSVRSRWDPERQTLWAFATPEDFEKTSSDPRDLPAVLQYLCATFPSHPLLILLWQPPGEASVRVTLGGEPKRLAAIQEREPVQIQNPHVELVTTFPSFRAAEEHLNALLREVW